MHYVFWESEGQNISTNAASILTKFFKNLPHNRSCERTSWVCNTNALPCFKEQIFVISDSTMNI